MQITFWDRSLQKLQVKDNFLDCREMCPCSSISAESNKSYYSITYYGIKQFISLLVTSLPNFTYNTSHDNMITFL